MSHKPNNVLQPKENAFIKPVAGISSSGAAIAMQQKQLLLTKKVRRIKQDLSDFNNILFFILVCKKPTIENVVPVASSSKIGGHLATVAKTASVPQQKQQSLATTTAVKKINSENLVPSSSNNNTTEKEKTGMWINIQSANN